MYMRGLLYYHTPHIGPQLHNSAKHGSRKLPISHSSPDAQYFKTMEGEWQGVGQYPRPLQPVSRGMILGAQPHVHRSPIWTLVEID
jgi:hypothetical protein